METQGSEQFRSTTPERALCMHRWNFAVVKLRTAQVHNCCRLRSTEFVSREDLEEFGTAVFNNSQNMKMRRLNMLKGKRDADCAVCWKLEDAGAKSPRTPPSWFVHHMNQYEGAPNCLAQIVKSKESYLECAHPNLEIQVDNICDLQCLYCWPEYSIRWEKHLEATTGRRMFKPDPEHIQLFQATFWKWYDEIKYTIRSINFVGGEPSASDAFFEVATRIYSETPNDGRRRRIAICSNFNAAPVKWARFKDLLVSLSEKFDLSVEASCEAKGRRAEYIRAGLRWEKFETNFKQIMRLGREIQAKGRQFQVGAHMSHNLLSLASLPQYIEWLIEMENIYQRPIHLQENVVSVPSVMSPFSLPPVFAVYFSKSAELIRLNHTSKGRYGYDATWEIYADYLDSLAHRMRQGLQWRESREELFNWLKRQQIESDPEFFATFPEYRRYFMGLMRQFVPVSLSDSIRSRFRSWIPVLR